MAADIRESERSVAASVACHSKHLSPSEILILRLTRTRLCSAFYYNYKAFVITIALLYYTVLIVTNMTGNSNCFDHFDVPCIPTRHLVSWRFHLCEIKLHCLLFVTITVLLL